MSHPTGKPKGEPRPKSSKQHSDFKKEAILQDLKAGFKPSVIAERNQVSGNWVSILQTRHKVELEAHFKKLLEQRQEQIDIFLAKHEKDMIEILNDTTEMFKLAIKRHKVKLQNPDTVIPTEITQKNKDGKTMKGVPAGDITKAYELWKGAQSVFAAFQRVGDE